MLMKEFLQNGDLDVVSKALQTGADVNMRYEGGYTPIIFAAVNGHDELVKVLLEHGADVNAVTDDRESAVGLAVMTGKSDVVKVLLQHGADVRQRDSSHFTLLMKAFLVEHAQPEIVCLLCEGGIDVNAHTPSGLTALMIGAYNGHLEAIKPLLDYGVDVCAESKEGATAYKMAKAKEHKDVARLLFQHGAHVPLPPGCMAVTITPHIRSGATPILSLSKTQYPHDTEACVCDNPEGQLSQEYHGTGLPLREHPDGETIIRSFGEERIICDNCGSSHVLVITLKWSINPMQGDFYCDCEVVCQECRHFTAFSASTY